jgi:hypothetical protein
MDQHFWPEERTDLVLFGEREVGMLVKLIGKPAAEGVNEFRYWKLQGHQKKTLKRLIIASNTILPTSAECEGFFGIK